MAQDSHVARTMRIALLASIVACGSHKDAPPAGAAPTAGTTTTTTDSGAPPVPTGKQPVRTPMKQPAELATDAALTCDLKKTSTGF